MSYSPIKARATGGGKDFEPVPAGTHFGICISVVYIGIQSSTYDGETKEQPKVWLGFEIPDVKVQYTKNGEKHEAPATIGRMFTLSISDKSNLGPFLENWRGKGFDKKQQDDGFDITSILGKVCNLGVIHEARNGKTYANISSAGSLLKIQQQAIEAGTLSVTPYNNLLSFNADEPDVVLFEKLPKFLKEKIANRVTTTKTGKPLPTSNKPVNTEDEFDDDIPF
jgi:hypothetical protein